MLVGTDAAVCLNKDYHGTTTHRRSVQVKRFLIDLHCRVRDSLMVTSSFNGDGYLHMLGIELGSMDGSVFEILVQAFLDYLALTTPTRKVDHTTVLGQFPADYGLYTRMTDTAFYRSLRYMMSKYLSLCSIIDLSIVLIYFSGADYKQFLDIEGLYLEPQLSSGHLRVFVYLGCSLTVYAGNPFINTIIDQQQIPRPMLDGSM